MEPRLLAEGMLDVKVPRGSTDRKLWKAWRRQWISFSLVPAAGGEPLLQLSVSRKAVAVRRGELRIFRPRSRSRPLRTWALLAAGRVLLFLAAEDEAQAQGWMRRLREGLWPASLERRISTACAYEVSLIDDDATFQSGLLGAYGHLVSGPEAALCLVHPHWGSTLFQVPLSDVQNVLVLREDEQARSGAFGIVFVSGAQATSSRMLQFYCDEVNKVVQWIFSLLIAEDIDKTCDGGTEAVPESNAKEGTLYENLKEMHLSPKQGSDAFSDDFNQSQALDTEITFESRIKEDAYYENLKTLSKEVSYTFSDDFRLRGAKNAEGASEYRSVSEEGTFYENLEAMNLLTKQGSDTSDFQQKGNRIEYFAHRNDQNKSHFPNCYADRTECTVTKDECDKNREKSITFDHSCLEHNNNTTDTDSLTGQQEFAKQKTAGTLCSLDNFSDNKISNLYEDIDFLEQSILSKSKMLLSSEYTEVDKSNAKEKEDSNTTNSTNGTKYGKIMKANLNAVTLNPNKKDSQSISELDEFSPSVVKLDSGNQALHKEHIETGPAQLCYNPEREGRGDKEFERISLSLQNSTLLSSIDTSPTTDCKPWTNELLIDCDKPRRSSADSDIFRQEKNETDYDDEEFADHIYDHLTERKGTIYEEIDEGEDEEVVIQSPQLPEKPQNVQAQSKLLKLSKSISAVLEEMTALPPAPAPSKQTPCPKLVHKIKDTSRIMHI